MNHATIIAAALLSLAAGCALDTEGEIESSDDLEEYADETEPPEDDELGEIEYGEPTGSNLLANPGFESGSLTRNTELRYVRLSPWSGAYGTDANLALSSSAHSGQRSFRVVDSGVGGATSVAQGGVTVAAGASYELSAWTRYRGGGSCSQQLGVYFYNSSGDIIGRGPLVGTSSSAWTKLVGRFTAPAGTRSVAVHAGDFRSFGDCGTYDWDDVSLRRL